MWGKATIANLECSASTTKKKRIAGQGHICEMYMVSEHKKTKTHIAEQAGLAWLAGLAGWAGWLGWLAGLAGWLGWLG